MKICFLCDLHLPHHMGHKDPQSPDAIQYDVLRWAMDDIRKKQADALVVPGDFTVHGDIAPAETFLTAVQDLGIPYVICTGNSEYRNPETKAYFRALASPTVCDIGGGWRVLALHDGEGQLPEEDYAALEMVDERCIVAMHHPFSTLPSPHWERLQAWREKHPTVPVFYGHLHHTKNDGDSHMLPAADPDKVAGEQPGITYYDTDTRKLETAYYFCPIPVDLLAHIGISCYRPAIDIPYAAENHLSCIELRPAAMEMDPAELDTLVHTWRQSGGTCLSLHAPDLADAQGQVAVAAWERFIAFADRLHCDRITVHVPSIALSVLRSTPDTLTYAAEFAAAQLQRLPEGCVVGMENMHICPGETAQERRYGATPEECLTFIRLVRERCDLPIGMHLDVGHARNNMPLVETYTLGPWYAEVGADTVGYHIHQVLQDAKGLHNHNPISNFYGPMISYASFFKMWTKGILHHAPVILEVRPTETDPMPYRCSIEILQKDADRHVFDIHSHTHYSFCGRDDPQLVVDTAVENGIRLFGICDHNYGIGKRKAEYLRVMRRLAEENRDRLRMLVGIEIATIPQNYDIADPAEISGYDYCLIEHITQDESIVGGNLFGFCDKLGIRCGIAHTDMFAYCDKYGYDYRTFFAEMAKRQIFWEMNVSYDSIHRYREHGYVKDFMADPGKQSIVRDAGVYISVGFDGHRREDYDGYRVHRMCDFLQENGFRLADALFEECV